MCHFDRLETGEAEAFLSRRRRADGEKQGGEDRSRARGASQGVGHVRRLSVAPPPPPVRRQSQVAVPEPSLRVVQAAPPVSVTSPEPRIDRKSVVSGKSVSVRVDPGGRRLITKKLTNIN